MKRHVQQPGIRKWSGNDLLELQAEGFKVLDGFLSQFGDLVITGVVAHANGTISPGLVSLGGMVMPFAGGTTASYPAYLIPRKEEVERKYLDGATRPVTEIYTAQLTAVQPSAGNYIEITAQGARCFPVGDILSARWSSDDYADFNAPEPDPAEPGGLDTRNLGFQVMEEQLPEVEVDGEQVNI